MNTRTERMNNKAYCAYCGKELRDYSNCFVHTYPEPPLVCDCEKAKSELKLYDELKTLYNMPLAENLIDMKVSEYKNRLLGICDNPTITNVALGSPITVDRTHSCYTYSD